MEAWKFHDRCANMSTWTWIQSRCGTYKPVLHSNRHKIIRKAVTNTHTLTTLSPDLDLEQKIIQFSFDTRISFQFYFAYWICCSIHYNFMENNNHECDLAYAIDTFNIESRSRSVVSFASFFLLFHCIPKYALFVKASSSIWNRHTPNQQ